eukprot:15294446-Heterocapsa_arctica.AAC.1
MRDDELDGLQWGSGRVELGRVNWARGLELLGHYSGPIVRVTLCALIGLPTVPGWAYPYIHCVGPC